MRAIPTLDLLGTPLLLTDYDSLGEACREWARSDACVALDFANTQIVTMRRHERWFRNLTSSYDAFPPDGMPLIWCLNWAGAGMRDRVYGPTFMNHFMGKVSGDFTHYLLGGSEECGAKLIACLRAINPKVRFVGGFHGRCLPDGHLEPEWEEKILKELDQLSPDFIWVGFGTPKQQGFVRNYKDRICRGVILTVGFAFDVNAGMKPDAPPWMQRLGMTWIYRLWSEPRRLGPRYLKYNFLFLFYLLWDAVQGKAWKRSQGEFKPKPD